MMQLTSNNLALLLDEVSAMVSADRPIANGLLELGDRSLGRLGRTAKRISAKLQSGTSPDTAFASESGNSASEVAAAFRMLETLGTAAPLRCIARSIQSRNEARSQFVISLVYPAITLLVAYLVLVFLVPWMLESSLIEPFGSSNANRRFVSAIQWLRANFWLPPVILAVMGVVWFCLVRPLFGWAGRTTMNHRWALFCDLLAIEVEAGVETKLAIASASEAAGDVPFSRRTVAASESLAAGETVTEISPSARFLPPLLRWSLSRIVNGSGKDHSLELRLLGDWYRDQAASRYRFWIHWFPVLTTVIVMTVVVVIVAMVTLVPLYQMLG
jgi:type II secretory pathway component PulF